jgi:hypothetical protein
VSTVASMASESSRVSAETRRSGALRCEARLTGCPQLPSRLWDYSSNRRNHESVPVTVLTTWIGPLLGTSG